MEHRGFETYADADGNRVRFSMPPKLCNIFDVELFCRSNVNDAAEGDPAIVWKQMSSRYSNAELVAPHQVHGTDILYAHKENAIPLRPEADGIYFDANSPCMGSLRFADCTPVVIGSWLPKPWLFILHSGFVGTLRNISSASFAFLKKIHTVFDFSAVYAWIGPSICSSCYSRNLNDTKTQEAISSFSMYNIRLEGDSAYINIRGEIRSQLRNLGVSADNIYEYDECTLCGNDKFYSYRAGDKNRRLFLIAGVPQNTPLR